MLKTVHNTNTLTMNSTANESIEIANLRLMVRGGLRFELQEQGVDRYFVIHDETTSDYFQIGVPEYALISLLDGQTSLHQAIEETAGRLGADALTIRDAIRIGQWLVESGLASVVDDSGKRIHNADQWLQQTVSQSQQHAVASLNPLFLKIPLGNPQPLISALAPLVGWSCSKAFAVVWFAVVSLAATLLLSHSTEFFSATQQVFSANSWVWLLGTLVVLKVIHELAHGLFCHRFGGQVRKAGIVLILLIPMPFVDVTSCWGFNSKWKRIAVAAAGMYAEIFVAAVAAIVWTQTSDPVLKFHLFNVMLLGSITTVLFNANFLMRFDGYYILSDLVGIPNLYQKGQQFVNGVGSRWLLGDRKPSANEVSTFRERITIRGYGVAALVWRVLICVSLTILATALFYGFGVALAILAIMMWVGTPLCRMIARWRDPAVETRANKAWISFVTLPVVVVCVLAVLVLPWPVQVSAPAIVEFDSPSIVRAEAAGFVSAVHVQVDQQVEQGDVLVELENRELDAELSELQLEHDKSLIRSRSFHRDQDIAAYQAENAARDAIADQIEELQHKRRSLTLVAATSGRVLASNLDTLPGQFLPAGNSVLQIVDPREKRLKVSIGQDEYEPFSQQVSRSITFLPRYGNQSHSGVLNQVEPTASKSTDPRFGSHAEGPLSVAPIGLNSSGSQKLAALRDESAISNSSNETAEDVELLTSRFDGEASILPVDAEQLACGTIGTVRVNQFHRTVYQHLTTATRRWIQTQFRQIR
jgi:putative peptide zinc metalloprotease protein